MSKRPAWLKVKLPGEGRYRGVRKSLADLHLHTVCEEARCPNLAECWGCGTATFLILGDCCTRGCRFCDVKTGHPETSPDPAEPRHVAQAVTQMGLRYAVITSVDRDDLPDGGADHFVATVEAIKGAHPEVIVELLTPDFGGQTELIATVAQSGAEVLGHNLETVKRLTPALRDRRCSFDRSLEVLEAFRQASPSVLTKSSLMLGLGEQRDELTEAFVALRSVGVDWLTLGQYLQPSRKHAAVERFVPPEEFEALRQEALDLGFELVSSGPLVRSSYKAAESDAQRLIKARQS